MPTTLTNGIQLPDKGSVDWYNSMQSNYNLIDTHLGDTDVHVTAEDKANWNSKQGSLSQAQLDAIAQVATNTSDIATLQSDKADASHTHSSSDITDIGDYATKQYVDNSISGLVDSAPNALDTLNELAAALNDDANFATTVTTALSAKANSADLATVATSGSYNDLSNKPTINDSTITIQKNGSTVDTFTTNGSAKTINIPVPTKTSDLTNDSNFVVSSSLATVATSGFYNDLDNKPTIPSKISDLIDDSNFVDIFNPAVSSGITSAKVTSYDSHVADTDIHVTTADKNKWNNQTYVFRYSSTALVASSTNSNTLLDNTDNLKVGDKVIDSDGVLFSITAIDTANSTFTIGTALIDLAQDSDVVHKSGNEYINGDKTFGHGTLIVDNSIGSNVHGEIKLNGSRSGYIVADNASDGVFNNAGCGVSILLQDAGKPLHIGGYKVDSNGRVFVDNTNKNPVLSITSDLVQTSTLIPENDTGNSAFRILSQINYANGDTSKVLDVRFVQYDDANASSAIYSNDDGKTSLGATSRRWSKIYGTEYYYGSNNVEFSTKFVTTDTAQTVSGVKTFSSSPLIYNSDTTASIPQITLKNQKVVKSSTTETGAQFIYFTDKNNNALGQIETRVVSNGTTGINITSFGLDSNNQNISSGVQILRSPTTANFAPSTDNAVTCGRALAKWSDVQTYQINGLTPSSLSLPNVNINSFVDISGYFTNTGTGEYNTYPVTANGWIFLRLSTISSCQVSVLDSNSNLLYGTTSSGGIEQILVPVVTGTTFQTQWATASTVVINKAYFIPCQGNI